MGDHLTFAVWQLADADTARADAAEVWRLAIVQAVTVDGRSISDVAATAGISRTHVRRILASAR